MKEKCYGCNHYEQKDGLDFCDGIFANCGECGCELEKVNEKEFREFKAFNGHLWKVWNSVCKGCGHKEDIEVESYPITKSVFNSKICKMQKKLEVVNEKKV